MGATSLLLAGIVREHLAELFGRGSDDRHEIGLAQAPLRAMRFEIAARTTMQHRGMGGGDRRVARTQAQIDHGTPVVVTRLVRRCGRRGAVGLVRTLGVAWAEDGIRVNGIAPGLVDTKLTKVTTDNPKRLEGALAKIPLQRLGTPADMAGAALFLASPLSSYIVGQSLVVDGGLIL